MSNVRRRGENIRRYIVANVGESPRDISRKTAQKFGITRQAVNKHLKRLVQEHFLIEEGETRNRTYKLAELSEWTKVYQISKLEEDVVWRRDISSFMNDLPDNVRRIWNHGFTEMFNNAIDHSEGSEITVSIKRTAATTRMIISDNGIGIFRKIQAAMKLLDERHAILELAKGKLTTDPTRHSGEGIFFTSRMFDEYVIISGGVYFSHQFGDEEDWIGERRLSGDGTAVFLELDNHTSRTAQKIFDQWTSDDSFQFNKTVVPVRLAQYGNDQLVSRSQAKRLLSRVELFKVVLFDFTDVASIGQAFADEIFRVFANQHSEVEIHAINTYSAVQRVIERARAGLTTQAEGPPEKSAPDQT
jgi:anti-sigma regulatory factor (Ser/Thr protein kinase)